MMHQPNIAFEYKKPTTKRNVVYGLILLCTLSIIVTPIIYVKNSVRDKTRALTEAQAQYDRTMTEITSNPVDIIALSNTVETLKSEHERLTKENYHMDASLFIAIEQALPKNVWILEYSIHRNYLYLKGLSTNVAGIETFFNALDPIQKSLKLKVSRGVDNYEFEITTVSEAK